MTSAPWFGLHSASSLENAHHLHHAVPVFFQTSRQLYGCHSFVLFSHVCHLLKGFAGFR